MTEGRRDVEPPVRGERKGAAIDGLSADMARRLLQMEDAAVSSTGVEEMDKGVISSRLVRRTASLGKRPPDRVTDTVITERDISTLERLLAQEGDGVARSVSRSLSSSVIQRIVDKVLGGFTIQSSCGGTPRLEDAREQRPQASNAGRVGKAMPSNPFGIFRRPLSRPTGRVDKRWCRDALWKLAALQRWDDSVAVLKSVRIEIEGTDTEVVGIDDVAVPQNTSNEQELASKGPSGCFAVPKGGVVAGGDGQSLGGDTNTSLGEDDDDDGEMHDVDILRMRRRTAINRVRENENQLDDVVLEAGCTVGACRGSVGEDGVHVPLPRASRGLVIGKQSGSSQDGMGPLGALESTASGVHVVSEGGGAVSAAISSSFVVDDGGSDGRVHIRDMLLGATTSCDGVEEDGSVRHVRGTLGRAPVPVTSPQSRGRLSGAGRGLDHGVTRRRGTASSCSPCSVRDSSSSAGGLDINPVEERRVIRKMQVDLEDGGEEDDDDVVEVVSSHLPPVVVPPPATRRDRARSHREDQGVGLFEDVAVCVDDEEGMCHDGHGIGSRGSGHHADVTGTDELLGSFVVSDRVSS